MDHFENHAEILVKKLLEILKDNPQGITEYLLINRLKENCSLIPNDFAKNPLSLFRTHFVVFNGLYRLQRELAKKHNSYLEVGPLNIQIHPSKGKNKKKALADNTDENLRRYYLDMNNLYDTTEEDVNNMLSNFWKKYNNYDKRIDALAVLGLDENATYGEVKRRYRRLAKENHPDRGGEKEGLQRINWAMDILDRYYG